MRLTRKIYSTSVTSTPLYRSGIMVGVALWSIVFTCVMMSSGLVAGTIDRKHARTSCYSMVFIIHGDGSYLYHDSRGNARMADQQALRGAVQVALSNPRAEVFIFHQRPARFALFFIPLQDGDFRYYRNGKLIVNKKYWRSSGSSRFDAEVELYHKYSDGQSEKRGRFLLYFGHTISEINGKGYDASYPQRRFNISHLSEGVRKITGDTTKFDLIVLSTCFGGTPRTIAALAPFASTIIASPENLHLSYFDVRLFERLDRHLLHDDVARFAEFFARRVFRRLLNEVQTSISVVVYNMDRTREYRDSVDMRYLRKLSERGVHPAGAIEYVDCNEESAFRLPGMSDGVYVLFRPAQFGRAKDKRSHSGWQCSRLVDRQ
jgi:hypothetical protein